MGQSYNLGYDVRRSGGLWINFDHLRMFNVRQNLDTQALSFLPPSVKWPQQPRLSPHLWVHPLASVLNETVSLKMLKT